MGAAVSPTPKGGDSALDLQSYAATCERAARDPDSFFAKAALRLDWIKPFGKVSDCSFNAADLHIRWFEDGVLNVSANCIDRHLSARADQTALLWEGDDPGDSLAVSYRELHARRTEF